MGVFKVFRNLKLKVILWLLGVWFWLFGFAVAQAFYKAKISDLKTAHANELLQYEQQAKQQFQAALIEQQKWQQFANQQSEQIAQLQQKLDDKAAQQQKEIAYVIQKDNSGSLTFNGLGNDSLQHYKKSLGYTD